MLTLFHAPQTRSTRILWLLEELGASYRVEQVGIRYGDGSGTGPDAANPHPDGKVPALVQDGTLVTESAAIALHLCETFPEAGLGRLAGDPERAAFLTWLAWTECEFGPAMFSAAYGLEPAPGSVEAVYRRLTGALATGPYLMGERFSAVDVMVGSGLVWMRGVLPADAAIDGYLARITSRPAWQQALAKDGQR